MMIIATDPGSEESAYVIMDEQYNLIQFGKEKNEVIQNMLYVMSGEIDIAPDLLVCEMVASYGMAVGKTVFDTCVWIGRFCATYDNKFELMYRKTVKMHLCNSMKAKDSNIRQVLIDRFGEVGTKKKPGKLYGVSADVWSALAIAITWFDIYSKEGSSI